MGLGVGSGMGDSEESAERGRRCFRVTMVLNDEQRSAQPERKLSYSRFALNNSYGNRLSATRIRSSLHRSKL